MSLFSGLYVGASGLVTNQNALNTTAHNLSNIGTTGYTRQQIIQANKNYDTIGQASVSPKQVGLGVSYADVRAVRDYFLDKAYRQEQGRAEFYTTNYNTITEIETLFGELQGVAFQESLSEFTRAIEELKKQPEDGTNQGLVASKAQTFLERAQAVYSGLSGYQDNINIQVKDNIDKINEYGKKIWEINQKIVAIETGGIERANDLRDARDQLLDKLAALGKVSYDEDYHGIVTVEFEGVEFVTQDYVNEMGYLTGDEYNDLFKEDIRKGLKSEVDTDFYIPTWPKFKHQEVFSVTEDISSDKNTDIGALKALYNSRGNHRATYRDLFPVGEFYPEYGDIYTFEVGGKTYNPVKNEEDHYDPFTGGPVDIEKGIFTISGTDYFIDDDGKVSEASLVGNHGKATIDGNTYTAHDYYISMTQTYSVADDGKFTISGTDYYIDDEGTVREGSPTGTEVGTVDDEGKVDIGGTIYNAIKNGEGHYKSITQSIPVADDGKFTISDTDYYIDDTTGTVREGSPTGTEVGTVDDEGKIDIGGNSFAANKEGHYRSITQTIPVSSVGKFTISGMDYYISDDGKVREGAPDGTVVDTVDSEGKVTIEGTEYNAAKNGEGHYESMSQNIPVSDDGQFKIFGEDYHIQDSNGKIRKLSFVDKVDDRGNIKIDGNPYFIKKNSEGKYSSVGGVTYFISDDGIVTDYSGKEVAKLGVSETDSINLYNRKTARSSVMTVMAEFDNLVRGIVTGMNKILSSDGSIEGKYNDNLLFSRISSNSVPDGTDGWTTANLMINPTVQKTPSTLNNGFLLDDGSRDQLKADALAQLFYDKYDALNPNTGTPLTFAGYYSALVSENATYGKVYKSISTNQEAMVMAIDNQRQEVVGVSDSDELTQMIRYQNAYNASSRYINTINSMLDTLINAMT